MNRPIARRALRLRASLLAQRSARRSAALLSAALLSAGVLAGCGAVPADEPTAPPLPGLSDLIREQAELHPAMRAEDLYKLVYQATRGPRHIFMGDDSQLEAGLDEEVARMAPSPVEGEPMIELLDPRANLARVNLRPWLRAGGTMDDLARAVGWTNLKYRGDRAVMVASLAAAADLVDDLPVAFDREDFVRHVERMKARDYPTGAHSEVYAQQYEPAYRLVLLHHLTDRDFGGRDGVVALPSAESRLRLREPASGS